MKLGWNSLGTSFDCACGVTHSLPIEVCDISEDAALHLARFAREKCGRTVLVISDENTRHAAGDSVCAALSAAGKAVHEHVFRDPQLEATDELGETVAQLGADMDFFVAIGSGTLCDLAKYAGNKLGRPALLFATAASMNGYTSSIVAMKIRGLKRTAPVTPALGVFADPRVVATAPIRMAASGVGDFLSKFSSSSDWYAAHVLRGDYHCRRPADFFEDIQDRVIEAAPRVRDSDAAAIDVVLEALMLAGFSMVVAGSSAPASGGEHLISHYLDMKHALRNTAHDLHGAQVGVATIHTLGLWRRVLELEREGIDIDRCVAMHPAPDQIRTWIMEDWGQVGPEIVEQWRQKELDSNGLRAEIIRFKEQLDHLRDALSRELMPAETVAEAIGAAGGPVVPEELNAPIEEYRRALRLARFLRNRFTILDLAAELGLG